MPTAIPVTIIGGYLGAGKTTLINHLLRHAIGRRLAVLVNDFGELPIDADLIEADDGDVISLSGGCICCSYGDDLSLSLQTLKEQALPPEHIVIESSGVALPGAIAQSLSLIRAYELMGIVVLADATTVQTLIRKKYIGDTIQRQLNDADLIILNKLDRLSDRTADDVRQWLEQNFSNAKNVDATFGKVNPALFLDVQINADVSHKTYDKQPAHNMLSQFSSLKLDITRSVDANELAGKLADKKCGLIRAKGFVLDSDQSLKTIQVVGSRWSVTEAPQGATCGVVCIACSKDVTESNIRAFCGLK